MNYVVPFYANAEAAADMDRRFHHIVTHRNALMGNQPWGSLSSVIFGLEVRLADTGTRHASIIPLEDTMTF